MLFCCLEAQRGQFFRRKMCHIIATLWCIQLKLWKKKNLGFPFDALCCCSTLAFTSFPKQLSCSVGENTWITYTSACTYTHTHTDKVCLTPDLSTQLKNCHREWDIFVWRGRKATLLRKVLADTVNKSNTSEGTVGAGNSWEMWFST